LFVSGAASPPFVLHVRRPAAAINEYRAAACASEENVLDVTLRYETEGM
jgi:hypothetical protein